MADTDKNSSSRIAFTLPLSCQICLGKVKLPVVCPNQHVFCSPCMDVWLQRNQQCPSCRVPITTDNPCKKILGGLAQGQEEETNFTKSKELRRSRLELLCKDYEDEIERLQMENDSLHQEKHILEEQVKCYTAQKLQDAEDDVAKGKPSSSMSSTSPQPDMNMLMMLTKKLQDATGLYDRVKKDMDKLKQENCNVKEENATLTRENQRVRMEFTERSPRKFGRFTVATLETKLERQEKEVKQLQKALERSDAYVEEIEKELESYRMKMRAQNTCIRCKCTLQVQKAKENDTVEGDDRTSEQAKQRNGISNIKAGEVSKSESSSRSGRLQPGHSTETNDKTVRTANGYQQSSSSNEDWRKLPVDIENHTKKDWRSLPSDITEEKNSVTVSSFYGKRPLGKEQRQGVGSTKPSLKNGIGKGSLDPDDTFELELPSPTSSSIVSSSEATGGRAVDQDDVSTSDSRHLPNDSTADLSTPNDTLASASSPGSCKKRLRFESDASDTSGLSFLYSPKKGVGGKKSSAGGSGKQVTFNDNVAVKNMIKKKNALSDSLLDVTLPSDTSEVDILNDIKPQREQRFAADESYDGNMSMNSDIMDCMELFSGAERRLGQIKPSSSGEDQKSESSNKGPARGNPSNDNIQQGAAAPYLLQTFPMAYEQNTRPKNAQHGMSGSFDYLGAPLGSYDHGPRPPLPLTSSSSAPTSCTLNTRIPCDNVSSSADLYTAYKSSSGSYADQGHISTNLAGDQTSNHYGLRSSGFGNIPPYHTGLSLPGSSETGSYSSSAGVGSLSGTGATGGSSIGSDPTYPARPASTSTLQGMLHTATALEGATSRPLSAPGAHSTSSATGWRNSHAPSSISSTSDFRPSSSAAAIPTLGRSNSSGLSMSQGSGMTGLSGGGTGGLGMLNAGLSASQGSLNGLPGFAGLPPGFPPLLPGGSGLSQPSSRYGGEFSTGGLFGPSSSSSGFMSAFGGGMTQ